MVDFDQLLALVPHYIAMLALAVVGLTVVQVGLGDPPALVVFGAVLGIVFLYPFVVRRLGYAPDSWT